MKKSKIAIFALSLGLLMGGISSIQGSVNVDRSIKKLGETEKAAINAESTKAQLKYSFTAPSGNFKKVTSSLTDWSGTYVIGYESSSVDVYLFDGSLSIINGPANYVTKSVNSGTLLGSSIIYYTVTISAVTGGYSIQSKSGYYMGREDDTDGMDTSNTTAYVNDISFNEDGSVNIVGKGGAYLRYDTSYGGQMKFSYFSSSTYTSYNPICLYKLDNEFTYTNMKMNFGAVIHKDLIDALTTAGSSVTGYGVAVARKTKIDEDDSVSSVTEALYAGSSKTYVSKKQVTLSEETTFIYSDETGTASTGDYVVFSINLNYPEGTAKYTDVVDAVAYLMVDGAYLVLQEKSCSVASLADEYIDNTSFFNTLSVNVQRSLSFLGALND